MVLKLMVNGYKWYGTQVTVLAASNDVGGFLRTKGVQQFWDPFFYGVFRAPAVGMTMLVRINKLPANFGGPKPPSNDQNF